jgi:hypothetical protein
MTESIDDLTVTYTEGGIETTKELDKVVLSRGSWATILYRYQDWDQALAVTYFRMGRPHTIIGDAPFHF